MPEFTLPKGRRTRALTLAAEVLASLDEEVAWRITAEPVKNSRTLQQNAYLFGVANKMISEHSGYELEEVHEFLCGAYFGWQDKKVPKTPRNPRGVESVPVRTTTRNEAGKRDVLRTEAFADYVDFVQRFAAKNMGIVIPDPDPDYQRKR